MTIRLPSVAGVLLTLLAPSAYSATPASGTLSLTNRSISYVSGPFVASNPGAVCGGDGASCDEFALTLDLAGVASDWRVRVTTSWDNADEDFDLYFLRPDGTEVDSSAGSSNPEVVTISVSALDSATYTLQIVPWLVMGGSTTTVVELLEGGGGGGGGGGSTCTVPGAQP